MVSGRGSNGRGGGQVGRSGSGLNCGVSSNDSAGEKIEAEKIRSDAAQILGSYRFSRGASSSCQPLSTALVVKTEPEDASAPAFAPGDYLNDTELERLLPKLGKEAGLGPGDFVDERHPDTVIGLVSQTSRREADKAEEWRLVAEEQGKIFVNLGSDNE